MKVECSPFIHWWRIPAAVQHLHHMFYSVMLQALVCTGLQAGQFRTSTLQSHGVIIISRMSCPIKRHDLLGQYQSAENVAPDIRDAVVSTLLSSLAQRPWFKKKEEAIFLIIGPSWMSSDPVTVGTFLDLVCLVSFVDAAKNWVQTKAEVFVSPHFQHLMSLCSFQLKIRFSFLHVEQHHSFFGNGVVNQ